MSNYEPRKIPDSLFRLRKDMKNLEKRIEKLESQNVLLVWVLGGVLVVAIAGIFF